MKTSDKRDANIFAMVLLPEPAGPSIATIIINPLTCITVVEYLRKAGRVFQFG
jgi:hypothetical protein